MLVRGQPSRSLSPIMALWVAQRGEGLSSQRPRHLDHVTSGQNMVKDEVNTWNQFCFLMWGIMGNDGEITWEYHLVSSLRDAAWEVARSSKLIENRNALALAESRGIAGGEAPEKSIFTLECRGKSKHSGTLVGG